MDSLITYLIFAVLGVTLVILLLLGLFILGYIAFTFYRYRNREKDSLDSVLLQVTVPRANDIKIDSMEQIISSLQSIKKGGGWKQKLSYQPSISFEIVGRKGDIKFYIWTPKNFKDVIEKVIHGGYSDAEVLEVPEYNVFTETGKVAFKAFQLKSENFKPIKTYREMATDPLSVILSPLAKLGDNEAVIIQLLLTATDLPWQKDGRKFIGDTKKQESDPTKAKYSVSAKMLEAIENKVGKPGFEVSLRVVSVADDKNVAKMNLGNVASSFAQFGGEFNSLGGRNIRHQASFMEDFVNRYPPMFNFRGNHASVMCAEEIATLFHFPNRQVTTPNIYFLSSKTAPAPADIPTEGLYLGMSTFRGIKRPVYLSEEDRRRHVYIVGATGTGKSELLKQLILQDIKAGKGVCFIDPHDTVRQLLPLIPPERAEDVIYFSPGDMERPLGLNLMDVRTEDEMHFVAGAIINMMYKLFDPYKTGIVGPRLEHGIRNAMLTVMQGMKGGTFIEVAQCFTRPDFVMELLPNVTDQMVKRYWTDQIAQTSDFHKSEVLDYTVSKFGRFITNRMIRNIIGQSQSSFDFRKVMDEGKILLIDLAKGEIGEENASFLGLVLVPRILMAAMSRANIPEEQRRDFYLYVDEFQNFATQDFATILSEARKYRLNLTVANQFIGQMEEEVKNAIFGNVGTKMAFRVGVTDASYLAHEFAPVFGEDDLLNVERFHAFVKTIVRNQPQPAFSMDTTLDLEEIKRQSNPRVGEIIKEMSRLKYGRDVKMVEAEIGRRARL